VVVVAAEQVRQATSMVQAVVRVVEVERKQAPVQVVLAIHLQQAQRKEILAVLLQIQRLLTVVVEVAVLMPRQELELLEAEAPVVLAVLVRLHLSQARQSLMPVAVVVVRLVLHQLRVQAVLAVVEQEVIAHLELLRKQGLQILVAVGEVLRLILQQQTLETAAQASSSSK
jgi:hypothetical protein